MEKCKLTPMSRIKEIQRERRNKNRILKMPPIEPKCLPKLPCKEIKNPPVVNKRKPTKDRDIPEIGRNPFALPEHRKIFTQTEKITRKKPAKPFDMDRPKTVIDDIHNEFFTVVSGKPIRPNTDSKLYMRNVRDILLHKQCTAYLRDRVLAIEVLAGLGEREAYEKTLKLYYETVLNYQEFLQKEFSQTRHVQNRAEKVRRKIDNIQDQLEEHSFTRTTLKNQIISLSDKLDAQEMYRIFLNKVAPLWWRLSHNVGFQGQSICFKRLFIADDDSDLFSLGVSILRELKCTLYFEKPVELMNVFNAITDQCHDYFRLSLLKWDPAVNMIFKYRDSLKAHLVTDAQELEHFIDIFENQIAFYTDQEKLFKDKFFRLLEKQFKELIVSHETLKLAMCIDYAGEFTLGNFVTGSGRDLKILMRQIEVSYEETMKAMEKLDNRVVNETTAYCMRQDKMMMKKAFEAQRALKEWELFRKALRASFEPPRYKYNRTEKRL